MKLILEPTVKEIDRDSLSPMGLIERIGRTCYKSTSEYTEETAKKFFNQLVERGHYAMLEHAILIFAMPVSSFNSEIIGTDFSAKATHELRYFNLTQLSKDRVLISGSVRAFNECNIDPLRGLLSLVDDNLLYTPCFGYFVPEGAEWVNDLRALPDITLSEMAVHTYMTLDIECDRGITHELVRHRNCAFAQESTRYCNYTKDKFGGEITFVRPPEQAMKDLKDYEMMKEAFRKSEELYNHLVNKGMPPELARQVLPMGLSSEIVITANLAEWKHIIDLRGNEVTGKAHPHAKTVAKKAEEFYNKKIVGFVK